MDEETTSESGMRDRAARSQRLAPVGAHWWRRESVRRTRCRCGEVSRAWSASASCIARVRRCLVAACRRCADAGQATALADAGRWLAMLALRGARMADAAAATSRALIAAYGTEVGELARDAHAEPRSSRTGSQGAAGRLPPLPGDELLRTVRRGGGRRSREGDASAFVHVVDCRRRGARRGRADCSGSRRQPLPPVLALLRGLAPPCAASRSPASAGYHEDDWESVQVRIGADGERRPARLLPPRLQLRAAESPTGAPTRGSARSATSPRRSAPAPRTAGARRPARCSSPAAATPATRRATSAGIAAGHAGRSAST